MARRPRAEDFKAYREGRCAPSYAFNAYAPPPNYTNGDWTPYSRRLSKFWLAGYLAQWNGPKKARTT